jgi:hypothetical protein
MPLLLLIAVLPVMAAIELPTETFMILVVLFCVIAGLTVPATRSHARDVKQRSADETCDQGRESDGRECCDRTAHTRKSSAAAG